MTGVVLAAVLALLLIGMAIFWLGHQRSKDVILDIASPDVQARVERTSLESQPAITHRTVSLSSHETSPPLREESTYRVRPGVDQSREPWSPFSVEQARVTRIRAARAEAQARARLAVNPRYIQRDSHYGLLGVEQSASLKEVERAYRREAGRSHPDRFQNDPDARQEAEQRLRKLNVAIAVLRDPRRRARYDASLDRPSPDHSA